MSAIRRLRHRYRDVLERRRVESEQRWGTLAKQYLAAIDEAVDNIDADMIADPDNHTVIIDVAAVTTAPQSPPPPGQFPQELKDKISAQFRAQARFSSIKIDDPPGKIILHIYLNLKEKDDKDEEEHGTYAREMRNQATAIATESQPV